MSQFQHLKGFDELDAFLQALPVKTEKNIARGALRAAANVVKETAKENIHSVSGELAKGLRVSTKVNYGTVVATLKVGGRHAFIGHMLEFTGARPHLIKAAVKGGLTINGRVVSEVNHPGFKPRPFMRPALDARWQAAVLAAGEYTKVRLATKNGLDTADIELGV